MGCKRKKKKDGSVLLKVNGAMSIYEVPALRDELLKCLETHKGLFLDLDKVTDCDITGVQLLCSARATAANMDKPFVVATAPPSVIDAVNRAGLDPEDLLNMSEEV
jgi:anti-anti-sigma factor